MSHSIHCPQCGKSLGSGHHPNDDGTPTNVSSISLYADGGTANGYTTTVSVSEAPRPKDEPKT